MEPETAAVNIVAHNMELTDRLQGYVEKKIARLDRYMPNMTAVHVDLSVENTRSAVNRQVAQITIRDDRGTILRAEERNGDMFAAIDQVVDKLYRQIERYRGKRRDRYRGSKVEDMSLGEALPIDETYSEEETVIVRRKQFPLHPMSAEEAIEQMELLGHDFYVFFSAEDEAVSVVYRRHDGNYGLLQPEMG